MKWEDFEREVNSYIENAFAGENVNLVSEYKSREVRQGIPTIEITIGETGAEEESFGDGDGSVDLHFGSVNMLIKTRQDFGLTPKTALIQKCKDLFTRNLLCNGYAKFRVPYKVSGGENEGLTFHTVICPFTFESIN